MDNIEWANVNTFKNKYSLNNEAAEEKAEEDSESEEKIDLSDSESVESKDGELDMFKKILTCLKPGETVLRAIKRLGAASSKLPTDATSSKAGLSASQRWLKKKAPVIQNKSAITETESARNAEQVKADMETLEALTGYANHFIDRGFYDIYEETYEKMAFKINNAVEAKKEEPADLFDMFADEDNEAAAGTSGSSVNVIEGKL